jgi:hypothetical protein
MSKIEGPETATAKKMAFDVHVAEYVSARQLVHTKIQQDRLTISFGISALAALLASIGLLIRDAQTQPLLSLVLALAPAVFSILGILNARSI